MPAVAGPSHPKAWARNIRAQSLKMPSRGSFQAEPGRKPLLPASNVGDVVGPLQESRDSMRWGLLRDVHNAVNAIEGSDIELPRRKVDVEEARAGTPWPGRALRAAHCAFRLPYSKLDVGEPIRSRRPLMSVVQLKWQLGEV